MNGESGAAGATGEVVATITALSAALKRADEVRLAAFFDRLAADLLQASGTRETRDAARRGLAMYGGMGSFNDLVLMDGTAPDIAGNRRLDELRVAVHAGLTRLIAEDESAPEDR